MTAQEVDAESGYIILKDGRMPPPPCFRYTDESRGTDHEIFVTPKQYWEVVKLEENKEWEALSKYPPYSGRPPLPNRMANVLGYTDSSGVQKRLWLPPDDGKAIELAGELYVANDWGALEKLFEPYTGQKHPNHEMEQEYQAGVERCREAREEAAAKSAGA